MWAFKHMTFVGNYWRMYSSTWGSRHDSEKGIQHRKEAKQSPRVIIAKGHPKWQLDNKPNNKSIKIGAGGWWRVFLWGQIEFIDYLICLNTQKNNIWCLKISHEKLRNEAVTNVKKWQNEAVNARKNNVLQERIWLWSVNIYTAVKM